MHYKERERGRDTTGRPGCSLARELKPSAVSEMSIAPCSGRRGACRTAGTPRRSPARRPQIAQQQPSPALPPPRHEAPQQRSEAGCRGPLARGPRFPMPVQMSGIPGEVRSERSLLPQPSFPAQHAGLARGRCWYVRAPPGKGAAAAWASKAARGEAEPRQEISPQDLTTKHLTMKCFLLKWFPFDDESTLSILLAQQNGDGRGQAAPQPDGGNDHSKEAEERCDDGSGDRADEQSHRSDHAARWTRRGGADP